MIRDLIKREIEKAVKSLCGKEISFQVSISPWKFGDYSSTVALCFDADAVFSTLGTVLANKTDNAKKIAEKIKEELEKSSGINSKIKQIKIEGSGFLNFYLQDEVFVGNIAEILKQGEKYGANDSLRGQKIMVEYTDPNPFKEFHIGHLMTNTIGESLARFKEFCGAEMKRACYQGDVGMHVAKAIWEALNQPQDVLDKIRLSGDVADKIAFWGEYYKKGAQYFEAGEKEKQDIAEINKKIYEGKDLKISDLYNWGRVVSLDYFEEIYELLGMARGGDGKHFDYYFFESKTGTDGKKIVEENMDGRGANIFAKSDGAVIFPEEKSGLHTRVFINSEGLPTYEAKELGLAKIKYDIFPYDDSIVVTANEINDYFRVLLRAMELIFPDIAAKTRHISHGMLRLPTGKMSSRTGNVIKAMDLLADIEKMVRKKIADRDFGAQEKDEIAQKVALAAIKYSILKQSPGRDIIFDMAKSVSFEGDSGPYLQYTCVRAMSVLKMAEEKGIKRADLTDTGRRFGFEITDVEKLLQKFPEVVMEAEKHLAPNYICSYLVELAHAFNAYYAKNKIVTDEPTAPYRVALTEAVAITLKKGLWLLGISVPERM